MTRGPKVDRQELRHTILSVASSIVKQKGFAELSIRKIAKEIGCAVGTIYNVYANLDEIILSINSVTLTKLHANMEKRCKGATSPYQAALKLSQTYVDFSREEHHSWSLLVDYQLTSGMSVPDWYAKKIEEIFSLVREVVSPIVGNDHQKADQAAKVLWAGLHGVCSLGISGKLTAIKAESADVLAESLVSNFLKGLTA